MDKHYFWGRVLKLAADWSLKLNKLSKIRLASFDNFTVHLPPLPELAQLFCSLSQSIQLPHTQSRGRLLDAPIFHLNCLTLKQLNTLPNRATLPPHRFPPPPPPHLRRNAIEVGPSLAPAPFSSSPLKRKKEGKNEKRNSHKKTPKTQPRNVSPGPRHRRHNAALQQHPHLARSRLPAARRLHDPAAAALRLRKGVPRCAQGADDGRRRY